MRRHGRTTLPLILAIVLAAVTPVSAEDVELTLRDCLLRAAESSFEVRSGRYLAPVAQTGITVAKSEFDHLFSFRASGGKTTGPSSSFFQGADELSEQRFAGSMELGAKALTGGWYAFGFRTDDLVTNSEFYYYRPLWTSGLTFRFEQPLLRTAGTTYNEIRIRLAEKDLTVAEAEYRGVLETTMARVEQSYWDVVFLREDLEVRKYSLRVAERLREISDRRRKAGAGTKVEVIQSEAGVADREKQVILAEKRVRDAEDRLRSYVFPFAEDALREIRIVPTDKVAGDLPTVDEDLPGRIRTAFDLRPDVLAARARLESAGIRVVQAENELLPRLDVFGSLGYIDADDTFPSSTSSIWSFDYPGWEIGVSLEIPLGNRAARSRHRRAVLTRSRSIAEFEGLKNRVVVDVRTALRLIDTSRREIAATEKATRAAEAQYEAEKDRLEADRSTNYFLLQKEADLSRARSEELLAIVAYRKALVVLEESTGTYLAARGLIAPPSQPVEPPEEEGGEPSR
ncbi:MAG: TolC family protein [Planctomycetota bacterium]